MKFELSFKFTYLFFILILLNGCAKKIEETQNDLVEVNTVNEKKLNPVSFNEDLIAKINQKESEFLLENTESCIELPDVFPEYISDMYNDILEGTWFFDVKLENFDNENDFISRSPRYKVFRWETVLEISCPKNNSYGTYCLSQLAPLSIDKIEFKEPNVCILYIYYPEHMETESGKLVDIKQNDSYDCIYEIKIINRDKILIGKECLGGSSFAKKRNEYVLYRIDGKGFCDPQKVVVNSDRVRLRNEPDLNSFIWDYLNYGDSGIIKDKSDELYMIDGESWYWYKVDFEGKVDGWVYGKYLDILDLE